MKTIIHKATSRGHFNHGWLNTWHTFSFARYYEPERVNFGALRVLNDDVIAPGTGFGRHPHDNMEIITIPLEGKVLHRDSMGNEEFITPGEVQVMSAGTGIFHEEHNGSAEEYLSLLQIWIFPDEKSITPTYAQKNFSAEPALNNWQKLVSKNDDGTLHIHQDANISRVFLEAGKSLDYTLSNEAFGSYLFIINGEINLGEMELHKRDGVGIYDATSFSIRAKTDAYILNLEVPKQN